jgi:hypothetical protein
MKRVACLCLIVCFFPAILSAGPIYGVIFFNGNALRGASISIECPAARASVGATLDDGSYRVAVPQQGRCRFNVTSPSFKGSASADVLSLSDASPYNFTVVQSGSGYALRKQ